jgi:segregation and condensation protein B
MPRGQRHGSPRAPAAWPRRDRLPRNHPLPALYRLPAETDELTGEGELARDARLAQVEAALLAADEPLTARRLATAAGLADAAQARRLIGRLRELYDRDGTAFQVVEVAGGYQLLTRPQFHPWLVRLRRAGSSPHLSGPARETLAIIAYRQPITRADIEAIRGVGCSDVLGQLMDRNLIHIAGREDSLGRPILYGTTKKFLQLFGLKSLRDLPAVEGLRAGDQGKSAAEGEGD